MRFAARFVLLIPLWAAFWAADKVCNGQTFSAFSYLDLPDDAEFDQDLHRSVADALENLNVQTTNRDFRSIVSAMEVARDDPQTSPGVRHVYEALTTWPEGLKQCSRSMIDVYQSALAQSRPLDAKLNEFNEFIKWSLGDKMKHCASMMNQELKEKAKEPKVAPDFQTLFEDTFHMRKNFDNLRDLHERLSSFDITSGQFDANQMLKTARSIESESEHNGQSRAEEKEKGKEDEGLAFLDMFMSERCNSLERAASRYLDALGLDRLAANKFQLWDYDERYLLLSEYRRICLAWKRPERSALARENIKKQLRPRRVWAKLFRRVV